MPSSRTPLANLTKPLHLIPQLSIKHNDFRVESLRSYVRAVASTTPIEPVCLRFQLQLTPPFSYNKYLSVAARVVRRSLKDENRLQAEKRGEMELRFAKWTVSDIPES